MSISCEPDRIKQDIRAKYDAIACGDLNSGFCMAEGTYDQTDGYVASADLQLGCGLPFDFTNIQPGERVLDLGSGAGMDAFIALRHTGPTGTVWGLDMSPAMVDKARRNAEELGADNVIFFLGDIEEMPFEDASVDLVISNCTLNLVPDKDVAYAEIYRVLRPGGRFVIADVVRCSGVDEDLIQAAEAHAGCSAGAVEMRPHLDLINAAGFSSVTVQSVKALELPQGANVIQSIIVCGQRPALEHASVAAFNALEQPT